MTDERGPSCLLEAAAVDAWIWLDDLRSRGIDLTVNAHKKVAKEGAEFADDPSLEEAADVFIALIGAVSHAGHSISDFARAVIAKVEVNYERVWVLQPDGTFQHDPATKGSQ